LSFCWGCDNKMIITPLLFFLLRTFPPPAVGLSKPPPPPILQVMRLEKNCRLTFG